MAQEQRAILQQALKNETIGPKVDTLGPNPTQNESYNSNRLQNDSISYRLRRPRRSIGLTIRYSDDT